MAIRLSIDVSQILFVVFFLVMFSGSELSLEAGLQFSEEPRDVIVLKNHAALLNCSAFGLSEDDSVEISWRKDGVEVVADRRVSVLTNGSLYFRRLVHNVKRRSTDEGKYECVATNRIGAIVSRQAFLQVADLSHFSGQPLSSTVTVGETVHFRCQINGVPKPTITWEKNSEPLPLWARFIQLPSYSLLIYNVSLEDAGSYGCRAENVAGERASRDAELTVVNPAGVQEDTPPRFLIGPRDQHVAVGGTALLECASTGGGGRGRGSQPLIRWARKDGIPLPNERIRMLGYNNLEIRDVQESDAGVYGCSLPDWSDVPTARATLTVLVPPRLVETTENIVRPTAHTVRMTCEFNGVPTPNITWLKNGDPVKSNGRIKIKGDPGTLLISQSTTGDSGLYQCWAENTAGRAGMIVRLHIQSSEDAPDPPRGLRSISLSSRAIELTWDVSPPTNGRRTMAYSVHYLLTNGGPELQKVVKEPQIRIEQLQPHASYTFYVVAYNDRSASQHSKPVTLMTLEDVPIAAPEIQVFPAGATSLKVQWEELHPDRARGTLTQYQIYYRKHGQSSQNVIRVDGPVSQYSINGLETGETYDIRVLAGTQVGFPAALSDDQWPWVSQVVTSAVNIGVTDMANVQFVVVNSTTIHLFWDLPTKLSVELLGFKISYKVHGSTQEPRMIILDTVTNHPIHQLKPDTLYEISICPFTDLGDGDLVTKNVRTFQDGVVQGPPVPTSVTAEPLNETAILLTWSEPDFRGGVVTHFTVRYLPVMTEEPEPSTGESDARFIERISQGSEVILTDLSPFTVYQFTVQSHTDSSDSPMSQEVRCQTKEGRPGVPQNVVVYLVAPTDIEVNWQPPKVSNGVITSYVINYSDQKMAPASKWLTQVENGTVKTAIVSGLKPNTLYSIKVQAVTRRCEGPYSAPIDLMTREGYHTRKNESVYARAYSDRTMGIVIGICISGGCIVFCIVLIVALRKRPLSCGRSRQTTHGANGYAAQMQNGHPGSNPLLRFNTTCTNDKETDNSFHMITKAHQGNGHLDSKGGPVVKKCNQNGDVAKMNGFADYSKQNGGATESLLSEHKLSKNEPTVISEMSSYTVPSDETVVDAAQSTDRGDADGNQATTNV